MKDNKMLALAIDVCDLTKKGWVIDLTDNAFSYAYAHHQEHGTVYFADDEEFMEWKKAQYK